MLFALLVVHFLVRSAPQAWKSVDNDFPDYFVTASLLHEHYDTSRIYEWTWLQREKDHRGIDQRIINLSPSTPFSTLALYPLTGMQVVTAKRCWVVLSIGLTIATLWLLHSITLLPWRRLALVAALSAPLRTNLMVGQYYALLLFLLTLACYLYLRQQRVFAGVLVGIASAMKIFPAIYLIYFLRKKDWKAFTGGVLGGAASAVVSVLAFGWEANRAYLLQVLPATLRGEANDPYALRLASLPALLHRLFVYEPQLNPHPALHAAWMFAVLHPVLQMAVMAPALLLAAPKESGSKRVALEWAAILLASITISTSPEGYLFTLLIFPACVVLGMVEARRSYLQSLAVIAVYFIAGYLSGSKHNWDGWSALLAVPRLYALLVCCALMYALLMRQRGESSKTERLAWAAALGVVAMISIAANLRHQRGLYEDYSWRIATPQSVYSATHPVVDGDAVRFVGMTGEGYRLGIVQNGTPQIDIGHEDVLAVTAAKGEQWMERSGNTSTILPSSPAAAGPVGGIGITRAESPVASSDGRWLAFLREDHGRARLWLRSLEKTGVADRVVTPPELNVMEMSFLPSGELVFAAASKSVLGLFSTERIGDLMVKIRSLDLDGARYPAVSPDGRWLVYAQRQSGNWNLWLRDLASGATRRLTAAACNTTEPAWTADSKTLVYASDCGRALSLSALVRRQVIP